MSLHAEKADHALTTSVDNPWISLVGPELSLHLINTLNSDDVFRYQIKDEDNVAAIVQSSQSAQCTLDFERPPLNLLWC